MMWRLKSLIHKRSPLKRGLRWATKNTLKLSQKYQIMTQESEKRQACWKRWNREDDLALTPQERKRELVRIQVLIDEYGPTPEQKADLFLEQGLLYSFGEEYAKAIADYDKALEIKPDNHEAW